MFRPIERSGARWRAPETLKQGAQKPRQPAQEEREVVAGGGEHVIDAVAVAPLEIIAAYAVLGLGMADQRTASTYIFGAICPKDGKGAALVLPRCNIAAMTLHLAEIAMAVAPGAHAVLLLDRAGWHLSDKLIVPPNLTLLPLPPKCPELNPVENVWQFLRDNWLSNRVFRSYADIVDHCCFAWNNLVDQPWTIMSIGLRDWAQRF